MAVSMNTNTAATAAANNLSKGVAINQKSLTRLSSGSKIVNSSDDAGGLAVSMRMRAAMSRNQAASSNISNALSFLQTQEASLRGFASVMTRMTELVSLMQDVTKTADDLENYVTEMKALAAELQKIREEKFNEIPLFGLVSESESNLTVVLSEDGSQTGTISQAFLGDMRFDNIIQYSDTIEHIDAKSEYEDSLKPEAYKIMLDEVATFLATNGAQQSRLKSALESMNTSFSNMEAATSRIVDVDVAKEATQLAKTDILVKAGGVMLQQANVSSSIAMKLING